MSPVLGWTNLRHKFDYKISHIKMIGLHEDFQKTRKNFSIKIVSFHGITLKDIIWHMHNTYDESKWQMVSIYKNCVDRFNSKPYTVNFADLE